MPKRKRETTAASGNLPPPVIMNPAKQAKYCQKRLEDAQKPLLQALRHASQLERQKYSRRKKYATKKGQKEAVFRLNAEYNVLKALNLEQLGDQHLRKTLSRVKSLKDAEPLQEYISGIREGSKDTSTLNVTARMFKVVQVKKAVDQVIDDLKGILGVDKAKDNEKVEEIVKEYTTEEMKKHKEEKMARKAQRAKATDKDDVEMKDASDEADDPYMAFSARIAEPSSGEEDDKDSVSGDERPPSIADSESEHDPDADLEAASDSEDEAEEVAQPDDTSDDEDEYSDTVAISRSVAPASDDSADSASDSDSSSSEAAIPTKKTKTKAALEKPTSSAFLPALSHAAYFSGSESEASDLDADNAPRKNRRGQRARQKIAEAKFGAKAKHLEKQQQNVKFDPKRGAVAGDDKRQRRGKPLGGRGVQQSGSNAEPLGKKDDKKDRKMGLGVKRDDKGELHPSWQAAKLAKESKKLKIDLGGKGPAAGKKVVFD
ncbi:hypothetical protein J4E83_010208 [Alternaria metachromatica]|uniref:uncharacterized protein n=1 Tax=Alternaria metachromatica TaxID=283354 RepID=UPI0020C292A6|nr:uncharacterized protein J4E83_010208 [Alternaria metachromatica]KAI4606187.1 hypothetical protein J4E83_010208 [Alternaria metachromatica]